MTAGAISVPTVMPLRFPVAGKPKNSIDSNTLIEIRSGIVDIECRINNCRMWRNTADFR